MSLHAKDSKQEEPVCLHGIPWQACTMDISTGYTPLLIFKMQMDVDKEKEVRSLAEEDEVILSQSVIKRIKVESEQNTPIKDQKRWACSSEENGRHLRCPEESWSFRLHVGSRAEEAPYAQSILMAALC